MAFKMKYEIEQHFLPIVPGDGPKRRSGERMERTGFLVAHDTGNPGSTALGNIQYYIDTIGKDWAAAQIFLDDKRIVECIPWLTVDQSKMEKAMHVIYNVTKDNELFGDDANDIAGGIELCYGGSIDPHEAYKRYLWVHAYACHKFGLDPASKITAHFILDPARKTDPKSGLMKSLGITFEQFIQDVIAEYKDCTQEDEDNMALNIGDYEWQMLNSIFGQRYNNKEITDWKWIEKIRSKTLTAGELAFLQSVITARKEGLNTDAETEGMK